MKTGVRGDLTVTQKPDLITRTGVHQAGKGGEEEGTIGLTIKMTYF
jgi:hypothetical protein